MSAPNRWYSGLLPTAKQLALWAASIIFVAVVSGWAASYFTRQDNLELAFKQQQLSGIQKFQAGAGVFDTSLRSFNDALVDQRDVETARDDLRTAIAAHSSDTFALKQMFGEGAATSYIEHLSKLREEVDRVREPTEAMPMAQLAINLIEEREAMVKSAEVKIGGAG